MIFANHLPMKTAFFLILTSFATAQLQEALDEAVAQGTPGMAAVVFDQDQILASAQAGHHTLAKKAAIGKNDLWHIGSDTKAMTATLLARLVERDLVKWETTMSEVFKKEGKKFHPSAGRITVEQLLSHTAGLPTNPDLPLRAKARRMGDRKIIKQRLELVEETLGRAPLHQPGSAYLYSNTGYMIAGAVAEELLGTSWEKAMHQEIFNPLGMKTPGFGAPDGKNPRGHAVSPGGKIKAMPSGYEGDNPAIYGPAGCVHLSLDDWIKFARDQMGGYKLLKKETYAKLHQPVLKNYALGWAAQERDGKVTRISHNGSNTLWYARIELRLNREKGFLIVANAADPSTQKAIGELDDLCVEMMRK